MQLPIPDIFIKTVLQRSEEKMIQAISLATQGLSVLAQKQDQIANNLANSNTTGFKQSSLFVQSYEKYLADDESQPYVNRQIKADEVFIDYREGAMKNTGADLDVMIKGSGFFTVMTPQGIRYTRNGNFSLNPDGFLITSDGSKVMGKEGFIRLDQRQNVSINENGEIDQGKENRGTLFIADFPKPYAMLREEGCYFKPLLPDNPVINSPGFIIKQGFLEGSNVRAIQNMVDMINTYRNFEAGQKALHAHDQTLDKAVNSVGKLG